MKIQDLMPLLRMDKEHSLTKTMLKFKVCGLLSKWNSNQSNVSETDRQTNESWAFFLPLKCFVTINL